MFVCFKGGEEEKGHYEIPRKATERPEENVKREQPVPHPAGHPAPPSPSPGQSSLWQAGIAHPGVREPKDVRSAAAPTPPALYKHFHIFERLPQSPLHPGLSHSIAFIHHVGQAQTVESNIDSISPDHKASPRVTYPPKQRGGSYQSQACPRATLKIGSSQA